ncbi:U-box domain-containing protein 33-like [Carex rostrata]
MATAEVKEEQKVYVLLPRDFNKGKHILSWTLSHFPKDKTKIVATFITSPLSTNYSDALLNQWRERTNEILDEHVALCAIQKFKAEKLIHKNDDEVEGILELIDLMAVKNLVMGFPPNSKVAELVGEKANPSCKIWFIRNGNLLLTRHARLDLTEATTEEIEMELQRRKKLHVNEVEMELREIYMEEIEEIPKTENDKKDPLKREIEQLELVVVIFCKEKQI